MVNFGCCPGRPLLYTMCILGVLMSAASIGVARDKYSRLWAASTALYNAYFIFAVRQEKEEKLRFARHLALAVLIFSIIPLFIVPIVATSYMTSGMLYQTVSGYYFYEGKTSYLRDTQFNFMAGAIFGFIVEFSILLNVGWELIKFVLMHRFWKASKDDEVLPEVPGTPPVFYNFDSGNQDPEAGDAGPLPPKYDPKFEA